MPQIVLLLSSDVKEVCAWLGVSYGRWQEGFADEETYWRWTVEVPERSVLWYAWRRLARKHEQGYNPPFELKRRTVEMVRYYAWLQTTDLASSRHDVQPGAGITKVITDVAISTGHANADNDSETAPLLEAASAAPIAASTQPELPTEFALSGTTARDDNDRVRFRPRYRDYKPAPAVPAGSPVAYITRISELEAEIEKPARWDLDRGALRTLEHFGMRTRYFDVVAVRREEKRVLLCAQLRNVRQREEEMRSWRKWISARLRRVVRMLFRAVLKREKSE